MRTLKTKIAAGARRGLALAVVAGLTTILSGCGRPPESSTNGQFRAVATVGMIADVVRNVAGDKADVENLIGEGVDPHVYQPTRNDVMALSNADIIFYNGLLLEGKMGDVLIRVARQGKLVYAVTEEILETSDYVMTDEEAKYDPHVWMDVGGWIMATEVIEKALSEFDPANADHYRKNADAYRQKLRELDDYVREAIAGIPENQRVLVTAHDAFSYMGRAYDLEVLGIQGINTSSEAGIKDIENLVTMLVERKIPAVFVETSVSDKNVRALIEGARAQGHNVTIGGSLFSDAMGPAGTYEGTYIGMLDHNATTIAKALGGNPPAKGFTGQLSTAK